MDPAYIWLILGFGLMVAEVVGTDFFLLFLGIAAMVTAAVAFCSDSMSFSSQCILYGVLSLILVAVWLFRHMKKKEDKDSYQPNSGFDSLKGLVTEVSEVNTDGTFKIIVKDSVCLALAAVRGTEFSVGDRVRIVDIDAGTSRPMVEKI
jgi:membrane protein implicated in regulation of membrane protease activity